MALLGIYTLAAGLVLLFLEAQLYQLLPRRFRTLPYRLAFALQALVGSVLCVIGLLALSAALPQPLF